jgi:hypothetical protein
MTTETGVSTTDFMQYYKQNNKRMNSDMIPTPMNYRISIYRKMSEQLESQKN